METGEGELTSKHNTHSNTQVNIHKCDLRSESNEGEKTRTKEAVKGSKPETGNDIIGPVYPTWPVMFLCSSWTLLLFTGVCFSSLTTQGDGVVRQVCLPACLPRYDTRARARTHTHARGPIATPPHNDRWTFPPRDVTRTQPCDHPQTRSQLLTPSHPVCSARASDVRKWRTFPSHFDGVMGGAPVCDVIVFVVFVGGVVFFP